MKFPIPIPFAETLGFELLRFEGGNAEIALELRPELCNSWMVAHGGVTMTLLDVVMAHAARSPMPDVEPDTRGVVTIEMKTSFLRPGAGRLLAKGKLLHRSNTLAFCEASIFDPDQLLVAHATGTFKYLRGLAVGGKVVQRIGASD